LKQIIQSFKTGLTEVAEVPCPVVGRGQILIGTSRTLVSTGTERMLVEFGKAGWIEKARQQPEKVRMVLDKLKTDGLLPTIEAVLNKLDQPLPLGYCNVGKVLEVGEGVTNFKVGDRVASNGKHAAVVSVPVNLCAKVPENISDEEAAFTVLGAISLQGIRLAEPTLGEAVVVMGLGLVGLLTVQLLQAQGCRVLGIDFDSNKLNLAKQFGVEVVNLGAGEDPISVAQSFSRGRGVDAVIITASTKSSEPIHQAALMCRKRGRIVMVGVTGLELSRADFFEKELTFQVSCSYGPGRYDPNYEEKGSDYPIGFVRWTEQRNLEAVLDMMATGRLNLKPLISHHFEIEAAQEAYELLVSAVPSLGIILEYNKNKILPELLRQQVVRLKPSPSFDSTKIGGKATIAFIGSGNYATAVLLPAFKETGVRLKTVASKEGVSGLHAARKFGFEVTTTDVKSILSDTEINSVVITTRHDSHARLVCDALCTGKHVFVEKPLALRIEDLVEIESIASSSKSHLMIGFNRRFAPQVQKIKELLKNVSGPKTFVMTVNAGAIAANHWTHDRDIGGGRIIGEACHFIDLLRYLAESSIKHHTSVAMESSTGDTVTINLNFANGSIGTIHYFANGSKSFAKERLEIFASGRILQLDNFRKLHGFGWQGFKKMNLWRQDKGQKACALAFIQAVNSGGDSPIPLNEILETSKVTIEVALALGR